MDRGNRVAAIVDRGNHVFVIYVDTVDSFQKKLRVLRVWRFNGFRFALMNLRKSLA